MAWVTSMSTCQVAGDGLWCTILPGLSLQSAQPPRRARSCTSPHSKLTPSSYRKPTATQPRATKVRMPRRSRSWTSSQPRIPLVSCKLSSAACQRPRYSPAGLFPGRIVPDGPLELYRVFRSCERRMQLFRITAPSNLSAERFFEGANRAGRASRRAPPVQEGH